MTPYQREVGSEHRGKSPRLPGRRRPVSRPQWLSLEEPSARSEPALGAQGPQQFLALGRICLRPSLESAQLLMSQGRGLMR